MDVKTLRWLFSALLVTAFILANVFDVGTVGISTRWTNQHYSFAGGTTPGAIAFAVLMIVLYFALMWTKPPTIGEPLPSVLRRFFAFWCDFIFAMICITPLLGILPTIVAWRRTGVFAWNFVRTTYENNDNLQATIGTGCCAMLLILYFALPLIRRRPSPGSCICGYQIVSQGGSAMTFVSATLRVLLGFLAAAFWFVAFMGRDRDKGQFWLDKVFRTQAVRIS